MAKLEDILYPAEDVTSRVNIVVHPHGSDESRVISFNTSSEFGIRLESEQDWNSVSNDSGIVGQAFNQRYWVSMPRSEAFRDESGVSVIIRKTPNSFDLDSVLTGAAFGTRDENAVPTPEELWGELLTMPPEERNKRLERFIDAQDTNPTDEYRQERLEECSTEVSRVWKSGTKSPYKEGYYARRNSVKDTWPELSEAVDRLSRVL